MVTTYCVSAVCKSVTPTWLVQLLIHTRRLVVASLSVDFKPHCSMLALCSPKLQQVKLVGVTA